MTFLYKEHPLDLFSKWYSTSLSSVMTLATCSKEYAPSARVVLLKKYDKEGFVFFTNINSRKGKDLTENPKAALQFHWAEYSRQVRIEGDAKLLSSDKADEYYSSRSRNSQITAWCSKQSRVLKDWCDFEQSITLKSKEFHDQQIPRPGFWVGFCIIPIIMEFWQEGEHRRHIRFRYTLVEENTWTVEQLYP
ncbi:Pyridoxamine 5'-phosphate oxidase,Pyridoxamine 5'-phosphate oxidase, putative,Pyridoxine 5'-phosphate [Cinara cedri]|uniref:pyridoxal 5'-phosphate synthase n=1 Tax=Cinara cedri TaxID=506608 RepID=A0A5E4MIK6_9HEMI|nr:Pyridoxamine 5'-phosphate oxidase,Pyridoxamine 5'-phosphate oxidase, putative,Pyridoxine 5'-phosphate [Cinara cedri]